MNGVEVIIDAIKPLVVEAVKKLEEAIAALEARLSELEKKLAGGSQ